MNFFLNFSALIFSIIILIWGADRFIESSSRLANKFGISELTIGLTIVALGTSAPEIFVGILSVFNQTEEIAMGAIVGSNISNIALIFGISCLGLAIKPKKTKPIQFIPLLIASISLGLILSDLFISFLESLFLLVVFLFFLIVTYLNKSDIAVSMAESNLDKTLSIFGTIIIGILALIFGSNFAVIFAENIATILGVSELVIGLTIIAIGTSLPELAATISAIIKKKNEMVVGNVIGSNVLNIVLVVPIIGFFSSANLNANIFDRDYIVMIILTVFFIIFASFYSNKNISLGQIKFIGFFLLVSYVLYLLILSNVI